MVPERGVLHAVHRVGNITCLTKSTDAEGWLLSLCFLVQQPMRVATPRDFGMSEIHDKWRSGLRVLIVGGAFFLRRRRRKALERWLRGREEYRKLLLADWVLMSWGKSGRTWLRVMLSRFYQVKHGLSDSALIGYDNFKRINPAIPSVLFSHNNYLRDYTGNWRSKAHFSGKRIVLLVRDPRDVAVSQYFQWKHRMRPSKKLLNDYPPHGADISLYDFVMNPSCGVPKIVRYFNGWEEAIPELGEVLVVRYEDMRADPVQWLGKVLDFIGTPGTEQQVREAVEFAAYENMKKLEQKKTFKSSGARVVPGDRNNPDSYKVRRAKVGGYRDYFEDAQVAEIDRLVKEGLSPSFRYDGSAATGPDERKASSGAVVAASA